VLVPGKAFQLGLIFVSKAGAYPRVEQLKRASLGQPPDVTCNRKTRLRRAVSDKHSSLLQKFINYGRKKFYSAGPRLSNFFIIFQPPCAFFWIEKIGFTRIEAEID